MSNDHPTRRIEAHSCYSHARCCQARLLPSLSWSGAAVSIVVALGSSPTRALVHRSWIQPTVPGPGWKHHSSFHQQRNKRHAHHLTFSPTVKQQQQSSSSSLFASSAQNQQRRDTLLARNGPYFKLDRRSGTIEFGATANLVTQLDATLLWDSSSSSNNNKPSDDVGNPQWDEEATTTLVNDWLLDERGMALSIWDPKLMQERGNHIYRLQIMTLQFVTFTLAPWVDVQMKTVVDEATAAKQPVFTVQSVAFDPNIQILPGVRIDAKALGIVIEVVGSLRPGVATATSSSSSSSSSKTVKVSGGIAFQTTGTLPPPMRLLPESLLKATSDSINQTIVNFAIQSFQTGARANFREFVQKRKRLQQEQAAAAP